MYKLTILTVAVVVASALFFSPGAASTVSADPTCAGVFGSDLQVHGQHIVGDYVSELGGIGGGLEWPPAGGVVGQATGANGGAAIPGGPGPGFHFPNGFAPGASFCLENAHPNGFEVPAPHAD